MIFTSQRPLERAENIKTLFDAYDGEKEFRQMNLARNVEDVYDEIVVTDEMPAFFARKTIMIFHGAGYGKSYGFDEKYGYVKEWERGNIDYAISSSTHHRDITASQCSIDEDQVLPLGFPRLDKYSGKKKGDGGTILAAKRSYLYVPTFRRANEGRIYADLNYIDEHLTDDEIFAVKLHMIYDIRLSGNFKHIVFINSNEPSADYLIDSDVVITDYSTIMFDALVMDKPVVLFENDAEVYLKWRGMYFDYPSGYASRHCRTMEKLIDMMRCADGLRDADLQAKEQHINMCDGHATERIVEFLHTL